jgi:hypothetical protein
VHPYRYNLDPTHLKAFVQSCVEAYDELVVRTSADQKSLNNEGQCTLVACPPETPIPVRSTPFLPRLLAFCAGNVGAAITNL